MIADVTRASILAAIGEFDRCGLAASLSWHGFGRATAYELRYRGRRYPSKAVVGVAAGYQRGGEPLGPSEFSGGAEHSARRLVHLGFEVERSGEMLEVEDVALARRLALRSTEAPLRLYVCGPTSKRSIAECREHDFGALLSPLSVSTIKGGGCKLRDLSRHTKPLAGLPWAIDNGAWTCHVAGLPWREDPFVQLLERARELEPPSFAVIPDIVCGGADSLDFSIRWWTENRNGIATASPSWLLAVQDGMTVGQVRRALEQHQLGGIFVGGSAGPGTPNWKWRTAHDWAELGLELGLRVHIGRVNGERRAALCRDLGVTSIDGSSVSRFAVNGTKMGRSCDGTEPIHPPPGPARIGLPAQLKRDIADLEPVARHTIAKRRFQLALDAIDP